MKPTMIKLDPTQAFESRGRTITMAEILAFLADREEAKEHPTHVNEEGEADLNALCAEALAGYYWRVKALADDHARRNAKVLPAKVYGPALAGINDAADKLAREARESIAKEAGIALPTPKAPKAPPVQPLEAALADVMAAPAPKAEEPKPAKAPKARKAKAPKEITLNPAKAPTPDPKGDAIVAAVQASQTPKADAPKATLAEIVEWFRADTSRTVKAALVQFPGVARNKLTNCLNASKV